MADFINTVDVLGDNAVTDGIINRTIMEYDDGNILIVGANAFYGCTQLTSINFPAATNLGVNAFYGCTQLASVDLPAVTNLEDSAFYTCNQLTSVTLPVAISIGSYSFSSCKRLASVDLPIATNISFYVFNNTQLATLILRNNAVCTLANKNTFGSTPIESGTGYVYVPSTLIDSYKTATNWSTYANQFRALEDYTVDGTTTGELDPNKI